MSEIIKAIYEGQGLVRLEQEPEGVQPQARLLVLVMPVSDEATVDAVEGLQILQQQLQNFETRYAMKTSEFYPRFARGEMGDQRDFIVWAGLQELLERMIPAIS